MTITMITVTIRIDYSKNCLLKQKENMNRDRILQKNLSIFFVDFIADEPIFF